jgi:hypothetical protein
VAAERVDCSNEVVANLANGGIFLFRGIQVPEKQPNVRKYFSMLEDTLDMQAAWLFHLVGDIHQPLHTVQLFTREYPNGDRGGNEICVRVTPDREGDRSAQALGWLDHVEQQRGAAFQNRN